VALVQQEQLAEAETAARKYVELRAGSASGWNNLGFICFLRGELEGAMGHFGKAIELDESEVRAYYNLAMCRLLLGHAEPNWAAYQTALEMDREAGYEQLADHMGDLKTAMQVYPDSKAVLLSALAFLEKAAGSAS
jgi:tetratricopeptide (TPR) repeat protein